MKKVLILVFLAVLFIACEKEVTVYINDEPGQISGQVFPANATVMLKQYQMNTTLNCDEDGFFLFEELQPGKYNLEIKADGYGTQLISTEVTANYNQDIGKIYLTDIPYPIRNVSHTQMNNYIRLTVQLYEQIVTDNLDSLITVSPEAEIAFGYSGNTISAELQNFLEDSVTIHFSEAIETFTQRVIDFAYDYEIQFADLEVNNCSISNGYRISCSFTQPLMQESLSNSLITVVPAANYEINFGNTITLNPSGAFQPSTEYVVTFKKEIMSVFNTTLSEDYEMSFETNPLQVVSTNPYHEQYFVEGNRIYFDFSSTIKESTIMDNITIEPASEFSITTSQNN
ncbi:MAG: carboxypeptidase regulatory-like domain-containing protein [Candidatus Cloacimonetes bacterium]|nr:carboxypeptidase regulatory-like domain-containing protein [Candidatus Cloacimonadota bacterium]